jgi:hypothetical protein
MLAQLKKEQLDTDHCKLLSLKNLRSVYKCHFRVRFWFANRCPFEFPRLELIF